MPNLQGRIPNGVGGGYTLGQLGGVQSVTLNIAELPAHNHTWSASSTAGTDPKAEGTVLAGASIYTPTPIDSPMLPSAVSTVGGSQPHSNMMPYLVLNYCIALVGVFPSQN